MNNNYFTCIGKGYGAPCLPATREDWEQLRREPWLKEMCRRIEKGEEQLKQRLPVWTPHCAEFANNHRAIADAVKPLNRLMLDFDEKGHTIDILSKLKIDNEKLKIGCAIPQLHGMEILLVEESVRRGTHVLVELPEGMDADEAQRLMKEVTGFEPDKAVKDVSRCIYMVTEEHTKYVSDKLWEPTPDSARKEGSNISQRVQGVQDVQGERLSTPLPSREGQGVGLFFKGIPYASIIDEWWRRNGGEPQEGERNVKLHKLAVNLRAICDNKRAVLMQVMPRFGLSDEELKGIVDSACKESPKGISKVMQSIVDDFLHGVVGTKEEELETSLDKEDLKNANKAPQQPLRRLPVGLKESLSGVPRPMHIPVICAVLPIAAAYADSVEVKYCDGNLQRLGLMSIIHGEQASGKSVCKTAVELWKRQFDEEDAEARKVEEEWKEKKKSRKANEKAPDDPHVLIRSVPVTISCSTLLKRFKNARGHTLFSFCEELDTLRKTNGAGSWSAKYDIYRLSFDQGEWGQDYNSDAAESGVVKVAYNWTILGTDGAVRKCFKQDNVENGLSSRVLPSGMQDTSFSKMPKYGKRTEEEEARIQDAVTKLRSYQGFVDTPRLRKAVERWVEEKRVEAAKDIDKVKDVYRKRAAVIGFRCGVIHYLLSASPVASTDGTCLPDSKESKATIDFALMMAQYCMDEQIKAFGQTLEKSYVDAREECRRYGANHSAFDQLGAKFTMDDLSKLKEGFCSDNSLRTIIYRWCKEGWIKKVDAKHWEKVDIVTMSHCHNKG